MEHNTPHKNTGKKIQRLWHSMTGIILIVTYAIVLFLVLMNLQSVLSALKSFFSILSPVFIGIAIAFIANMPMHFLETHIFQKMKHDKLRRIISVSLAFIFVLLIVTAVLLLIFPKFIESALSLARGFDGYTRSFREAVSGFLENLSVSDSIKSRLIEFGNNFLESFDKTLSEVMSKAVNFTFSVISFTVKLLLAFVISVYALYNKEKLIFGCKKCIVAAFAEDRASAIIDIASRTNRSLHDYFYGMIIECTILAVMTYIMMMILGCPYAILISVIVGITQMVPIIGPWLSGAFGVLIILVTNPPLALWFAIGEFVVQQLEENLVYPHVVGKAVGLSGIWVMIAVILGSGLFGFTGVVLCVPVMAVLYTLTSEWINRKVEEKRFKKGMRESPPTDEEIKNMTEP